MKTNVKALLFFVCNFTIHIAFSQIKVSFVVSKDAASHSSAHLFIAGNFNGWDPGNKDYMLTNNKDGLAVATLLLQKGNYEYKFTRGDWNKVETDAEGKGVPNRSFRLMADTIIHIHIPAWSDDFNQNYTSIKRHTASGQVKVMDTAFYIPQLNRKRRILLYLPPDYNTSGKNYPVIYMHDGQNLFDEATSYAGEWGIDEYLDSIFSSGKKEAIVVGIDNGLNKRMTEYNPYNFQQFGKGEGDEYVDFLVKNLKPYIDKHYHTLSNKKNTFIAGSSMGGLISLYAALKYPATFGGAGIFSPAFWTAAGMDSMVQSHAKAMNTHLFFYAGGKEGESMLPDLDRITGEIKKYSISPVKIVIDQEANHSETAWRKYFPQFYQWTILKK